MTYLTIINVKYFVISRFLCTFAHMRYSGSKARIAKHIIPFIMNELKDGYMYIEPFMGGCNMLSKVDWPNKAGADNNRYVVSLWNNIRLSKAVIPNKVSLKDYEAMKILAKHNSSSEKYPSWLIGYVGNACSYGSAWFNGYAKYNPIKNEDHVKEAYNGMMKQIKEFKHLNKTTFISSDYRRIIKNCIKNNIKCVIYCDPPYKGTKGYMDKGFDHDEFWSIIREASKHGIKVFVSEYEAPDDFKCVWQMKRIDGMSTTSKNRQRTEKLFVYAHN